MGVTCLSDCLTVCLSVCPSFCVFLTSGAPVINGVTGCPTTISPLHTADCPREGNILVTLTGANFGAQYVSRNTSTNSVTLIVTCLSHKCRGASVRVGLQSCLAVSHVRGSPHNTVTCLLPPGTSLAQPITIAQFNGPLSSSPALLSHAQCLPGFVLSATNATNPVPSCEPCAPGRFTAAQSGVTQCVPCSAGKFAASSGSSTCSDCSRHSVAPGSGSTSCLVCPATQFAPSQGATGCTQCATNQYASDPDSVTNPCSACPLGVVCDARGVHALSGFYVISESGVTSYAQAVTRAGSLTLSPNSTTRVGLGVLKSFACLPGLCVSATDCGDDAFTCCGANRMCSPQFFVASFVLKYKSMTYGLTLLIILVV
jgi:hypothetical protein